MTSRSNRIERRREFFVRQRAAALLSMRHDELERQVHELAREGHSDHQIAARIGWRADLVRAVLGKRP